MSDLVRVLEESRPDWENMYVFAKEKLQKIENEYQEECEKMSMIIMQQREVIMALKKACLGMANALCNDEVSKYE